VDGGPAAIRHSTVPVGTVSSAWTRISASVPAAGEGTAASTLSVEISTSSSSTATGSPTCLSHSSTVPSATESPICGNSTSTIVPSPCGLSTVDGGLGAAEPSPLTSISASTVPTGTVSSGWTRIFDRVPATGAGTSVSTLSVET